MSNTAALGAIEYEAEVAWGEDVTTFATHRIPVLDKIDVSGLKQDRLAPNRVVQYRNDGTQWILGEQSGEIKTRLWLHGHGAATSGAVSIDAVEQLLSHVFGNVIASAASGTTATGGTAAAPLTTASATFTRGGLFRIGALGDGRCNGQFAVVQQHVTTTLNTLTALPAAPSNGDIVHSAVNFFPSENPTSGAVSSIRMRVLTANLQYELHGCYAKGVALSGLGPGELPAIEITWGVSWWRYTTATFPSAVASNTYAPAPNAAGSLFVQNFATSTRATRNVRNVTLDYTLGIAELKGVGGVNQYQTIVGARRTPDAIKMTWTEDAAASVDTLFTAGTFQHVLYTLNPTATTAVGIYLPRACVTGARPIQMDDGGINRQKVEVTGYTSTDTSSDLTLSAFRMAFA